MDLLLVGPLLNSSIIFHCGIFVCNLYCPFICIWYFLVILWVISKDSGICRVPIRAEIPTPPFFGKKEISYFTKLVSASPGMWSPDSDDYEVLGYSIFCRLYSVYLVIDQGDCLRGLLWEQ